MSSISLSRLQRIGHDKGHDVQDGYYPMEKVNLYALRHDSHEDSSDPTSPYVTVVDSTRNPDVGVMASR